MGGNRSVQTYLKDITGVAFEIRHRWRIWTQRGKEIVSDLDTSEKELTA